MQCATRYSHRPLSTQTTSPHLLYLFIGVKSTVFQLRITRSVLGYGLLHTGWAGCTKLVEAVVHWAYGLLRMRHAVGRGRAQGNGHSSSNHTVTLRFLKLLSVVQPQTRKQ